MNERRGSWYLLTGLILGLVLGLVYAWVISPIRYRDTTPDTLAGPFKDEYRRLIALTYQTDHNLDRARQRLALLKDGNLVQVLAAQAQHMLAEDRPSQEARALAILAADIGKPPAVSASQATPGEGATVTATPHATLINTLPVDAAIFTPTPPLPTASPTITLTLKTSSTPRATSTIRPSSTPRPTATQVPTLAAPFILKDKQKVCDGSVQPGVIEVQVNGQDGNPLPGVRITVTWQDGEDTFYTGFASERNPGYADFVMTPGVPYSLRVGDTSPLVTDLSSDGTTCGWQLIFAQGQS